jgi:hypothetical protein
VKEWNLFGSIVRVPEDRAGMAGTTGLEPATSDVTGRRSNQLNYVPFYVKTSDTGRIAQGSGAYVCTWLVNE